MIDHTPRVSKTADVRINYQVSHHLIAGLRKTGLLSEQHAHEKEAIGRAVARAALAYIKLTTKGSA